VVIVPRVATRLSIAVQAAALAAALRRGTGRPPPVTLADVLLAQTRFEGNDAPNNGNVGNLSAAGFVNGAEVSRWPGKAWRPPWFDAPAPGSRWEALHGVMLAGKEPSAFRAYDDLSAGFADWLSLLGNHYPGLLEAAGRGDVDRFAELYRSLGYCPNCKPADVAAALRRRRAEQAAARAWDGIELGPDGAGSAGALVLLAASVTAAVLLWATTRAVKR